ncbi:MAG: V-type ATPase subunit [Euryarchaeota archaeon]|nr:V-type ATPase subunit [Euryarchaeota archaeon]
MPISEYAYISAKVSAMKSFLLDASTLKAMAEAKSPEDALSILKNTPYGRELAKSSPSLMDVERVLTTSLVRDYEKISKPLIGTARIFMEQYAKKFETASIKTLIIMKVSGEKLREYPWIPFKTMTDSMIERLLHTETLEELIEMLKLTEYYPILRKVLSEYKAESAYSFIAALDKYVYGELGSIMGAMRGKDKEMTNSLIGAEIDAKNLIAALRLRGAEEKIFKDCLVPYRYKLDDAALRTLFETKRISELIPQLPGMPYGEIILQGIKEYEKTGAFFQLELSFRKYLLRISKQAFQSDRFHIGVPIAYLNLKENEVRNITAILTAKEAGLSASETEDLVIIA